MTIIIPVTPTKLLVCTHFCFIYLGILLVLPSFVYYSLLNSSVLVTRYIAILLVLEMTVSRCRCPTQIYFFIRFTRLHNEHFGKDLCPTFSLQPVKRKWDYEIMKRMNKKHTVSRLYVYMDEIGGGWLGRSTLLIPVIRLFLKISHIIPWQPSFIHYTILVLPLFNWLWNKQWSTFCLEAKWMWNVLERILSIVIIMDRW